MPGSALPPFSSLPIPLFRTPSGGLFWGTQFPPLFHAGFSNSPKIAPGDTRGTHFPALAPVRLFPATIQPGPCLGVGGGAGGSRGILGAKTGRAISGDTRGTHLPGIPRKTFPGILGAGHPATLLSPDGWRSLPRVRPRSPGWVLHRRQPGSGAVACPSSARTVGGGHRFPARSVPGSCFPRTETRTRQRTPYALGRRSRWMSPAICAPVMDARAILGHHAPDGPRCGGCPARCPGPGPGPGTLGAIAIQRPRLERSPRRIGNMSARRVDSRPRKD